MHAGYGRYGRRHVVCRRGAAARREGLRFRLRRFLGPHQPLGERDTDGTLRAFEARLEHLDRLGRLAQLRQRLSQTKPRLCKARVAPRRLSRSGGRGLGVTAAEPRDREVGPVRRVVRLELGRALVLLARRRVVTLLEGRRARRSSTLALELGRILERGHILLDDGWTVHCHLSRCRVLNALLLLLHLHLYSESIEETLEL